MSTTVLRTPLALSAIAAFLWVLARAHVQSITIDEATTYEVFVAPADPYQWSAGSNNHILNSLIMRLFVSVFGLSHLTARNGALLGALVYICAAVGLCRSVTKSEALRCLAFVCLACNPFVMDYLVAARGYALASGFLLAMLAVMARHYAEGQPSAVRACAACSAFAALSVAANFAFTFACASVLILFTLSVSRGAGTGRVLAAATVPGLLISAVLSLHAVATWPSGQLWWGAKSLAELRDSVLESVVHEPNEHLLNPWLLAAARAIQPWIVSLLVLTAALAALSARRDWRVRYAGVLSIALAIAVAAPG